MLVSVAYERKTLYFDKIVRYYDINPITKSGKTARKWMMVSTGAL